jgi:hypothetical protein
LQTPNLLESAGIRNPEEEGPDCWEMQRLIVAGFNGAVIYHITRPCNHIPEPAAEESAKKPIIRNRKAPDRRILADFTDRAPDSLFRCNGGK